ncbi:hypothetical protein [Nocardioides xinjiangensis]|uniref:hypothetical protein n=1 Tax=Nocardioides xinjiangensis TaxID=2817376 RepID=UPI001B3088F9|nr:hypothetical protein [Nocardioides sp. SYSU D00514]
MGTVVVLVAVVAALEVSVVGRLDRIEGAFADLGARPPAAAGETVLMVGTRPLQANPASADAAGGDVSWLPGEQAVESVMLVEIADDRRRVEVVSLPLEEELVDAVGAAARTSVAAVETGTDRRVDHVMAVDWQMLRELGYLSRTPLHYRYGSSPGEQQDFLQPVLRNTLHAEMRREPWNVYQVLRAASGGTALDDTWSLLELHALLLSLRDLRSADITFSTADPT